MIGILQDTDRDEKKAREIKKIECKKKNKTKEEKKEIQNMT